MFPVLDIFDKPIADWNMVMKTLFDRVAGALILLAISPVMVATAIAIKLDSPGPVFFRQTRLGQGGKAFSIFKFRTMTVCENGDTVVQAKAGDQRITRSGTWLRRTSLDELPQLLNVIAGDMSLVGPRPHARAHDPTHCPGHHAARVAFTRGPLHHRLGSRKFGQQCLDFVRWAFLDQKFENDADGFFRSRTIYADIGDQTCDQFVHYSLASPEKVRRARDILQGQRRG